MTVGVNTTMINEVELFFRKIGKFHIQINSEVNWKPLNRSSTHSDLKNLDLVPVFKVEKFLLNPSIQLRKF